MLSQFIGGSKGLRMLGELDYSFPKDTHAIGRLDYHSEGLLILTTNNHITKLLFESGTPHVRTYVVQAYKQMNEETLNQLRTGVTIRIKGGVDFTTLPCKVEQIERPAYFPFGKFEVSAPLPSTWINISLTQGKYRQIRKMLQALGHPCRRLIRTSIEKLNLGLLPAGGVLEVNEQTFFDQLKLH